MTTLRRILMATAQEQPVVADAEPKKKHSRRRFDEEKELHFEHNRNGYKRKRKEMSNGSGNDRNHREKDKSQPKRKLERTPSEKESAEKPKPKLKKKPVQGSQRAGKSEPKNMSNGVIDKKKKKKKVPFVPVDPPIAQVAVEPIKAKKPDSPERNSSEGKKKKEEEKEEMLKAKETKENEKSVQARKVDSPHKTLVVSKKPDVVPPKAEFIEKKVPLKAVTKVKPPSNTQAKKDKSTLPPPAPPAPVVKKQDDSKQQSSPTEVKKEMKKEKSDVKKADLKQGKVDALVPPPPPAATPSATKEPAKKGKDIAEAQEEKPSLKIEIPKPAPPKVKAETKCVDDVKKGSTDGIPKPEVKSAEKKRKRDEAKTPKDKSSAAVTTPAAHRPPKRVASMKCPGVNATEGATELGKDNSRQGKSGVQEENKDWVQCERCKEWFELPSSINPSTLPDHWYCEMKTWGSKNPKCCPPDKDAKRTSKPATVHSNGKKRNRTVADKHTRTSHNQRRAKAQVQSSRPRINNIMSNGSIGELPSKTNPRGSWKWVMCETCNQWRKVPPEVDLEKLPEKWYCSMNKWDPARASCSAPQEADETQAQSVKTVSSKKFVTLPDGVNMYGGQIWPVQKKQSPMNYRELIVNHYRNFKQWEVASSRILNERYDGTSLFIPRDVVRVKSSKGGSRKSLSANPKADCISRSAAVEESLFSKLFSPNERTVSPQSRSGSSSTFIADEDLQFLLCSGTNEPGLLKLKKPWKRVKWDWTKGNFVQIGKFPVDSST